MVSQSHQQLEVSTSTTINNKNISLKICTGLIEFLDEDETLTNTLVWSDQNTRDYDRRRPKLFLVGPVNRGCHARSST